MKVISTREAARKLGIHFTTLADHVARGKIPAPQIITVRGLTIHAWTLAEIEHVRQLLPKIANGRKTRYKKHSALSTQQSAKTKTQPGAAVLHKKTKKKKSKP
jgi:hypothetical protein